MSKWEFHIEDHPYRRRDKKLFVLLSGDLAGRRPSMLLPAQAEAMEMGDTLQQPFLQQTYEQAVDNIGDVDDFLRAALECAWKLGMRPNGYGDHTNELKATRVHLEDMRALVFKSGKP